jgi:hypothetical protein
MKVTVVPIIDPASNPGAALATVMNKRLERLAKELQFTELKSLETMEPLYGDVVIYISYNNKYNIRWRIVNDVPSGTETEVAKHCDRLGYLRWKTETINSFTSRKD